MSLVLDALRRVEKSSARPGSVGVAVTSYRGSQRHRGTLLPLLLGLGTGALLVFLWRPQTETPSPPQAGVRSEPGGARLPARPLPSAPSVILPSSSVLSTVPTTTRVETVPPSRSRPGAASAAPARTLPDAPPAVVRPPLILQAISERDSRPVAVINDQLVREGDLFEGARILRIGSESVDVLLESGKEAVVRFAPPPAAEPLTTPEAR